MAMSEGHAYFRMPCFDLNYVGPRFQKSNMNVMEFLLLTYDIFHRDPTLIIQQEHQIVLHPLLIEANSVGG